MVRIRARATISAPCKHLAAAGVQGGGCCGTAAVSASASAAAAAAAAAAVTGRCAGKGDCAAREGQGGTGRVSSPPASLCPAAAARQGQRSTLAVPELSSCCASAGHSRRLGAARHSHRGRNGAIGRPITALKASRPQSCHPTTFGPPGSSSSSCYRLSWLRPRCSRRRSNGCGRPARPW